MSTTTRAADLRRLTEFRVRLSRAERERGQGWRNAATWCAHLYLTQERAGCDGVERIRRRSDGGVSPDKLRALYEGLVAQGIASPVDEWCLTPALDVPREFWLLVTRLRDDGLPYDLQPSIDWNEIAEYLKEEYNRGCVTPRARGPHDYCR